MSCDSMTPYMKALSTYYVANPVWGPMEWGRLNKGHKVLDLKLERILEAM